MKKTLTIIWTLLLLVVIGYFIRHLFTIEQQVTLPEVEKSTEVFSTQTLDSLLAANEYVLLTVGYGDCDVCDLFRLTPIPDKFPIGRYYIDADYDNRNRLVMQSLGISGFPSSFVVDRNYDIIGALVGQIHLEARLDSILFGRYRLMPVTIPGVTGDKMPGLLSNSFRALSAYLEHDYEQMKNYTEASLEGGNYFFNLYLMYKYFEQLGATDAMAHYREQILSSLTDLDAVVYENLLTELDPHNGKLHRNHDHHH